ncbi:MAG: prepilin-type N-terminal cleavage/methylation domain-containing protein [Planctomycetes bacterium]|nr:prepilin-type N-terminal cleavage/methylation domain-containing protein [Planctomycetota bacterium]
MVKRGFTVVELLTAMAIIGILIGILIPTGIMILNRKDVQTTRSLVQAVVAAMAAYPVRSWEVRIADTSGVNPSLRHASYPWLWDLNQQEPGDRPGDGLIDGIPAAAADASHDGPFWSGLIASGYRGFAEMAMPNLPESRRAANGQPIDAWKRPLRVRYSGMNGGPGGYEVWSAGPDGIDGSSDDIRDDGAR